jgi:hypothetical protein
MVPSAARCTNKSPLMFGEGGNFGSLLLLICTPVQRVHKRGLAFVFVNLLDVTGAYCLFFLSVYLSLFHELSLGTLTLFVFLLYFYPSLFFF